MINEDTRKCHNCKGEGYVNGRKSNCKDKNPPKLKGKCYYCQGRGWREKA